MWVVVSVVAVAAQAQIQTTTYPKTIVVTGTAELEVIPDQIYVQVDLKEYDKKGQGKFSIEKIKNAFLNSVKSLGIPDSLISIAAYDSYHGNPWLRKKSKKEELYASISYQIKLNNSKQVDDLVNKLDDEATQNFFIQRTAHSQLTEYRKQLKIEAIKAAREKAQYLAEAIGEKPGVAVTINEPVEYYIPFYDQRTANVMMRQQEGMESAPAPSDATAIDFRKIKLKYDVTVTFALQ